MYRHIHRYMYRYMYRCMYRYDTGWGPQSIAFSCRKKVAKFFGLVVGITIINGCQWGL